MSREVLSSKVEALLFIAARPLTRERLARSIGVDKEKIGRALEHLHEKYKKDGSGTRLLKSGNSWQMATSEEHGALIKAFLKEEISGELTKPSLEALSIIAYRGPVSKADIEQIRGVNCSLILRNLLIRGFIEEVKEKGHMMPRYHVTVDFLKYLGVTRVSELPRFEKLNCNIALDQFMSGEKERK